MFACRLCVCTWACSPSADSSDTACVCVCVHCIRGGGVNLKSRCRLQLHVDEVIVENTANHW